MALEKHCLQLGKLKDMCHQTTRISLSHHDKMLSVLKSWEKGDLLILRGLSFQSWKVIKQLLMLF